MIQITLTLGITLNLIGQNANRAGRFFNKGQYNEALENYLLIDSNSLKPKDNLNIGTCFFTSNNTKGIKYFEKYIVTSDSINPIVYYYLGSLFHKQYKLEKSINTLQLFLSKLEKEFSKKNINSSKLIFEENRKREVVQ